MQLHGFIRPVMQICNLRIVVNCRYSSPALHISENAHVTRVASHLAQAFAQTLPKSRMQGPCKLITHTSLKVIDPL